MTNAEWEKSLNNSKQQTKVSEGRAGDFLELCSLFFRTHTHPPLRTRIPADQLPSGMQNGTHCILMTADGGATSTRLKLHWYTWQMGLGEVWGRRLVETWGEGSSLFCCRPQKSEQFINGVWMPCWSFPDRNKRQKSLKHIKNKKIKKETLHVQHAGQSNNTFLQKTKYKKWTVCNEWMSPFVVQHTKNRRRHEMRWRHDGKLAIILPIWQRKKIIK